MEHGRLFLTLRDCSVKDAHTLLESHESGSLFGGSSASSGNIGGATGSSFGGLQGLLECGHFMHTELLYAYPHRMMLEDGKIIARCSENQKSKLRL